MSGECLERERKAEQDESTEIRSVQIEGEDDGLERTLNAVELHYDILQ